MSRPRGDLHIETWFGGGVWHWVVKNLFGESIDAGEDRKKRVAEKIAREARNRHWAARDAIMKNG